MEAGNRMFRLWHFALLVFAGLGFLFTAQNIILFGGFNFENYDPIRIFFLKLYFPWPISVLSEYVNKNFDRNSVVNNLLTALYETLTVQGTFLFLLLVCRRLHHKAALTGILIWSAFFTIAISFSLAHEHPMIVFLGSTVLNTLTFYYRSLRYPLPLLAPFLLHFLWDLRFVVYWTTAA